MQVETQYRMSAWDEITDKCMQGMWKICIKSFTINIELLYNREKSDVIQGIESALNLDVETLQN